MIQIYNGIKLGKPDTATFDYRNAIPMAWEYSQPLAEGPSLVGVS